MATSNSQVDRLNELIAKWKAFRVVLPESALYCQLKDDLYQVRNAGWEGNPPIGDWPPDLYDIGKMAGVTPQHNPNKPTSKLTVLQMAAKEAGVRDGEADLAKSGKTAPWIADRSAAEVLLNCSLYCRPPKCRLTPRSNVASEALN